MAAHKSTNIGKATATRKINNSMKSLRQKNKELAAALDSSRKEVSDLKRESLELKRERQKLMERNMGLETQLISVRSMYTSLSKTVLDIESRLSHAKVLISSLEGLMMSPITPRLSPIPKLFRADKELKIQPSSTPIKDIDEHLMEVDDPKDFSSSFSAPVTTATMITTSHIDEDISDIGLNKLIRPKRACTALITSYQEPTIGKKLRQGDPFTDSFNVCLENIPAKHKKVKKTKDTPHHNKAMSSQVRRGLKDVTNYRV